MKKKWLIVLALLTAVFLFIFFFPFQNKKEEAERREDQSREETSAAEGKAEQDEKLSACLVLSDYTGDAAKDKDLEQLIETKGFPYTIAGIHLHDNVSHLENTVLKTASRVSSGGIGRDYYTSLELSRLGIERLTLEEIGETVGV